jgi:hypothetical protein
MMFNSEADRRRAKQETPGRNPGVFRSFFGPADSPGLVVNLPAVFWGDRAPGKPLMETIEPLSTIEPPEVMRGSAF